METLRPEEKRALFDANITRLAELLDTGLSKSQVQAVIEIFRRRLDVNPETLATIMATLTK